MKRKPVAQKSKKPKPPSKLEALQAEVAELRGSLVEVVQGYEATNEAFTKNTEAFSKSFVYVDTMFWILRTMMNDQLNGKLLTTEPEPGNRQVDLVTYLKNYEEHHKKEAEVQKSVDPSGHPVIFGGET